ncbi:MAG TPA: tetratricopeptide repeat protein [Chitinophagaceae bacterium]
MIVACFAAQSQATKFHNDPDEDFKLAKELFQKEQFSLAYPLFKTLSADFSTSKIPTSIQLESKFYSIVCGLQLNDPTAEPAAAEFINLEHNTPRVQMMSFYLAEYYYRKQQFAKALGNYERANVANLSNRQIAEMKFHQGYSYFTLQQFTQAKALFNSIRQIPSDPNYLDANYYYGFILFTERNYKSALESFRLVEKEPTYEKVVPYYITQIYYFNGERDKAIEYGEAALRRGGQYYEVQLKQLVGHAWFEKKEFAKALPYLEEYVNRTGKVRREDLYELSYSYYAAGNLQKAIEGFRQLGGKEDSLAQNSMYLLADAYLKTGQKANARNAFLFCAANSSNAFQREVSRFNYAKLSYELGYTDIALTELQSFIADYPKSVYQQEARELLVAVMANSNNYADALALFESLSAQSENVKRVYPRVLYGRAVELINDQQLVQAEELIDRLLQVPYNNNWQGLGNFWKGEIGYRLNRNDQAITYLNKYLAAPQYAGEVSPTNARYTLGYALMNTGEYRQALTAFEQVTRNISAASNTVEQDAFLRSADAHFMNKNYSQALQMYEQVIRLGTAGADYALYQKGIILGAQGKTSEKIAVLNSLEQRYPASTLIPDAQLEVANTYLGDEKFREAIEPLKRLIGNRNAAALYPQAYLKLGVAYFNLNDNKNALESFQRLVTGYPNAAESDDAVEYIRSIFIENGKPDEFVAFMRNNGKEISYSEEDSLTYAAARIQLDNRNMESALASFKNYLSKFPEGRYSIDAGFYAAEILNDQKNYEAAYPYYQAVAARAPNRFAERATLAAARIAYFERKDYNEAEEYFKQLKAIATQPDTRLEAMRGLLRCQYKLAKWTEAVANVQELLQQKGVATDDKMMANIVLAKSSQASDADAMATGYYRNVINLGKSEYAAEARYRIAEILLKQGKLAEAEKAAFEVINKAGSYDYWITRSYIMLGEIYFRQKDYFNAEATLRSVVENSNNEELKAEAQEKLNQVIEEKNRNSKVEE